MADAKMLEEIIENSGIKKSYLADECGLSRPTFRRRCQKPEEFTAKQVMILCDRLQIKKASAKAHLFL